MKKLVFIILLFFSIFASAQDMAFKITGTVFDLDTYVIITKDQEKAYKLAVSVLDSSNVDKSIFQNRGAVMFGVGTPIVLWIPSIPKNTEDYSILNHEIFHLSSAILRWAGIRLSEDTDELYAYMIQYYSKTIFEEIEEIKQK